MGPGNHLRYWVLAALAATVTTAAAQELSDASFAECRATVLPSAEEIAWRAIPWHDTFGAAVLEGDEQERPILLWAMNGHPLGCT